VENNELAFNAWILVGNVLNVALRSAPAAGLTVAPSVRERLPSLQTALETVPPEGILGALAALSATDRNLLRSLCIQSYAALGTEADTILGLEEATAAPILEFLQTK
jgi:hypothetical protein